MTIWHIFNNEDSFQHWSSKSHANCDLSAFWLTVVNIIKFLHITSKQNIKSKHFVKHQLNNSFIYMKRLEDSKNSCKIDLHEKKTKKSHDISRSNVNRHVKCQMSTIYLMRLYSNVLRIFSKILIKLILIENMLNHDKKCISTWIDDLTHLQHWEFIFFSIDRRQNHMLIAIFLFSHWLHQIVHQILFINFHRTYIELFSFWFSSSHTAYQFRKSTKLY